MRYERSIHIAGTKLAFGFGAGALVLDNVSFEIQRGERVAVMGQSGSGKTTLLKIIAAIEGFEPKSGTCYRDGHLAVVFQQPLLLDYLTVRDNILLPARLQNVIQPIDNIVEILDLGALLERFPFQLSGGQQRRVALARALAYPNTGGLLLDEPFTGLDEPLRERIIVEVEAALNTTEMTCIIATHSPFEAAFLADRVLLLGNSPSSIVFEHKVRLPKGERHHIIDTSQFFSEVVELRKSIDRQQDPESARQLSAVY